MNEPVRGFDFVRRYQAREPGSQSAPSDLCNFFFLSPHSCRAGFALVHLISPSTPGTTSGDWWSRGLISCLGCCSSKQQPRSAIAPAQGPQDPLVPGPPTLQSSPAQPFASSHSGCQKEDAGLAGNPLSAHPVTRDSCFPARTRALHGKVMPLSAGLIRGDFFLTLSVARLLTHGSSTASVFHSMSLQLIPG